jgi:hypothetical protein
MGISVFPAASSGGSSVPFAGAGSLAVSAYTTTGHYTTTLAAGKYVISVTNQGGNIDPQNVSTSNNSGLSNRPKWNYADSVNDQYSIGNESGTATVVNLTTTAQVWITNDMSYDNNPLGYVKYYSSVPGTQTFRGPSNYRAANSNIDVGIPFAGVTENDTTRYRAGWMLAPTTNTGLYANSSNTINQAERASTDNINPGDDIYAVILMDTFMFIGGSAGAGTLWSSSNSTTWTTRTTGLSGIVYDVAKGTVTNNYVAVSGSSTATTNISASTDGITWTTRNSGISQQLRCVTFGNNLYVAAGLAGSITTSTDGTTWSTRTSPQTSVAWNFALYNNNKYLLIAAEPTSAGINAAYSTDGTTWTGTSITGSARAEALTAGGFAKKSAQVTTSLTANVGVMGRNGIFAGGGYFWLGVNGMFLVSTDAITWSQYPTSPKLWTSYQKFGWSAANNGIVCIQSENNGHYRKAFPTPAQYYIYNHTA